MAVGLFQVREGRFVAVVGEKRNEKKWPGVRLVRRLRKKKIKREGFGAVFVLLWWFSIFLKKMGAAMVEGRSWRKK